MHRLLLLLTFSLLMSSLAAQPSDTIPLTDSARFHIQHIYSGDRLVDCTQEMNKNLETLDMSCIQSTFILGDSKYAADVNAVNQICRGGGKKVEGNFYRSNSNFRVVTCKLISGAQPPDCKYTAVTTANIQTRKITVRCQGTYPIALSN